MTATIAKISLAVIVLIAFSVCFTNAQGSRPGFCSLPPETGPCKGAMPKFYYNPSTGKCERFIYGGCAGNQNRFENIGDCQRTCRAN